MTIIGNGKRFDEVKHASENEFEEDIVAASRILFGNNIVFINPKKKIESKSLGGVIPDGFFFDFSDTTDPQFYIVEVELTEHSFYNHIFPQITKFFDFFKNTRRQKSLVDKLFTIIDSDKEIRSEFKHFLSGREIYKFLSDVIDTSQNILLIANGDIKELPEIMDTYTDTWGKLVKFLEIHKYVSGSDTIYSITPDFDTIQYVEPSVRVDEDLVEGQTYSEEFHLEGVSDLAKEIYSQIKSIALDKDENLIFNPQKYYISIRAYKNIAFLKIRKKKIRFIAMMPESDIRSIVKFYSIATLSQGVQDFYNGPCAAIDIVDISHRDEIISLIHSLVDYHRDG
jgi:predicted transport protein